MKTYNIFNYEVFSDFIEELLFQAIPFEAIANSKGDLIVKVDLDNHPELSQWLNYWDSKTVELIHEK